MLSLGMKTRMDMAVCAGSDSYLSDDFESFDEW